MSSDAQGVSIIKGFLCISRTGACHQTSNSIFESGTIGLNDTALFSMKIARAIGLLFLLTLPALEQPSPTPAPKGILRAQQAITPESQASASAEQETKQGVEGNLATIIQSGSTNTRGYKVVIHHDGSATAEISGGSFTFPRGTADTKTLQFPPGTIDTKTLQRLLTEIGDVSRIQTGGCPKSASFGTRTHIAYASKTSGDLQCIRKQAWGSDQALLQASEALSRFVKTTLSQLKINNRRLSSNQ
jgi:hypothetical protein